MLRIAPVDRLQKITHLGGRDRNRAIHSRRPDEPPAIQPLGVQRQPDPVVPNDLHQIAALAPENVQIAHVRITLQPLLHLQRQPHHPTAHIGVARRDPHPNVRRNRNHRSARKAAATNSGEASGAILTTAPPTSTVIAVADRSKAPGSAIITAGTKDGAVSDQPSSLRHR